jgi:hypothetical protein
VKPVRWHNLTVGLVISAIRLVFKQENLEFSARCFVKGSEHTCTHESPNHSETNQDNPLLVIGISIDKFIQFCRCRYGQ